MYRKGPQSMSTSAIASFRTNSFGSLISLFGTLFEAEFDDLSLLTKCISSRDRRQLFSLVVLFNLLLIEDLGGFQLDWQ